MSEQETIAKVNSISLRNVSKAYKMGETEVWALKDISLDIKEGEHVVFVGPSGSGKTTLLNLIGGIDTPTSGNIHVFGENIARYNEQQLTNYRAKHVGWIFQFFNLIPSLTALENVALALELVDETKNMYERSREALELVGLGKMVNKFPAQLSGGEQQRVAIARALVKKPRLLLADEPTGNLDHATGKKVMKVMKDLNKKEKITLLIVTHDMSITEDVDILFELRDGKIAKKI